MLSDKSLLLFISVLVFLFSCKKNTSIIEDPKKPIKELTVDTSKLNGYWKLTGGPKNYDNLYFYENNMLQDNGGSISDFLVDREIRNDSIVAGGVRILLVKLTADSLVLFRDNYFLRHKRVPLPETSYGVKTSFPVLLNTMCFDRANNIYGAVATIVRKYDTKGQVEDLYHDGIFGRKIKSIQMDGDDGFLYLTDSEIGRFDINNKKYTKIIERRYAESAPDNVKYADSWVTGDISSFCRAPNGDIYFSYSKRIMKIERSTGILSTIIGNPNSTSTVFNPEPSSARSMVLEFVNCMTVSAGGELYFSELRAPQSIIYKYTSNGEVQRIAGNLSAIETISGDGGSARNAYVDYVVAIAVNDKNDVLISSNSGIIRKINFNDQIINTIAGLINSKYNMTTLARGIDFTNARISHMSPAQTLIPRANGDIYFLEGGNRMRRLYLR